ncbi:MAG TPA: hypothetical protein VM819_22200 [Vicinamibacterales bacterium]|nr:hypothetical protein [Vicinamibacterales bacterium]
MNAQRFAVALLILAALGPLPATAQTKRAPRPGEVESDPIRCWWKADRSAIRVGERFTLVLTCGVIETSSIKVVPAANQLEPGAVSLTPFEAVAGTRHEDVVVPPWRYIQFEYSMRLLAEGFFGQEVNIPALTVTYNLQSPGTGNTEGRDQSYVLPALPMRVLSIVPRAASDIRDASGQTFANVESRRNRATAAVVGSSIAFAVAAVLTGLALVTLAGRFRVRGAKTVRPLAPATILRGSLGALRSARNAAAREGWTVPLMARAIAALRIAGAVSLGRQVAQTHVANGAVERVGQLEVRTGLLKRRKVLLSAATTPAALLAAIENGKGAASRETLQPIMDALQQFNVVVYSRAGEADSMSLTNAVDRASEAVNRMWTRSLIPFRAQRAAAAPVMPATRAGSAA